MILVGYLIAALRENAVMPPPSSSRVAGIVPREGTRLQDYGDIKLPRIR